MHAEPERYDQSLNIGRIEDVEERAKHRVLRHTRTHYSEREKEMERDGEREGEGEREEEGERGPGVSEREREGERKRTQGESNHRTSNK